MVLEITITGDCTSIDDGKWCPEESIKSNTDTKDVNELKRTVETDYQANILDDYDSYTYHFRLFLLSPDAIRKGLFGPDARRNRIVIAESGVTTGIGIDDVSITSFPAPSTKYGFGTSTIFRFTLTETLGATMLDKMFAAAKSLGIENIAKTPVFLELSFRGQNPDRTLGGTIFPGAFQEALLGGDDELGNVTWVWPIIMNDMTMNVDSGGSMYVVDAKYFGDMALNNQAADLEKKAVIPASTVKEFFVGLEKDLDRKEEDKVKVGKSQAEKDTYQFVIWDKYAQSKIISDDAEDVANKSAEFDKEVAEKNEHVYEPGTSIDKIIQDILSRTEHVQKAARGASKKDEKDEEGRKEKGTIQEIFRVYTDTKLGKFDKIRNDYARHYRYLIIPYEMRTLQNQNNRNANVSSQQRYDNIRKTGRLRKAYNYIYTGLNDQVFDFDLTFNFNWYAAEAFHKGLVNNSNFEPKGAAADLPENVEEGQKTDPKSLSEKLGLKPDSFLGQAADDVEDFVTDENFSESLVEGIATGDFSQLTGDASELIASQISRGVRVAGSNVFPNFVQNNIQEREALLEEETPDEDSVNLAKSTIAYLETNNPNTGKISGGYSDSPGRSLLTTLFEQATSPAAGDLQSISIRLKGDPYWLSPPPIGRNEDFKSYFDIALEGFGVALNPEDPDGGFVQVDTPSSGLLDSMNGVSGEVYFLFRSFTPREADPETGLGQGIDPNHAINGIYSTRVVEHSFSGGQYNMTVDAFRDLQIDLAGVDLGLGVADDRGLWEDWFSQGITPESVDEGTARADELNLQRNLEQAASDDPSDLGFLDGSGGSQYGGNA